MLSAHPGPGRRFSIPKDYLNCADNRLDRWLQSPALENLQELDLNSNCLLPSWTWRPPPPASVHRFSSTLRVASFCGFDFPDGTNAKVLHLLLLEQLTLLDVTISEGSLHAMLADCSLLQSLLLLDSNGFPRLRIVSRSLRSIGVSQAIPAPCHGRAMSAEVAVFWKNEDRHLGNLCTKTGYFGKTL